MAPEEFVSTLRKECIENLVAEYTRIFERHTAASMSDPGMRKLAEHWQAVDGSSRRILVEFIRLGSQNTLASVLSALDNVSADFPGRFSLTHQVQKGDEMRLNDNLLDIFWDQEEEAGKVNGEAT